MVVLMSLIQFKRIVLPTPAAALVSAAAEAVERIHPDELEAAAERSAIVADSAVPASPTYPGLTSKFLLAGKAIFTVANPKGDHYTFKVRRVESEYPKGSGNQQITYFVSVKSPGGQYPYRYIGLLNSMTGKIKCTAKSEYTPGKKEYDVAAWACQVVINMKHVPDGYKIEHAGRCGRCGLTLTDVESIDRGIGPDCWKIMGGK
jgi:hypothetical protein